MNIELNQFTTLLQSLQVKNICMMSFFAVFKQFASTNLVDVKILPPPRKGLKTKLKFCLRHFVGREVKCRKGLRMVMTTLFHLHLLLCIDCKCWSGFPVVSSKTYNSCVEPCPFGNEVLKKPRKPFHQKDKLLDE
ncbi:unnamed protein product [Larinioides sclopetarius]|uniref:Uncharacterized protein n=1 Tax=Larinioides sclopetarius TaxID=280406 RepID=A0AAV2A0N4_9ARAC